MISVTNLDLEPEVQQKRFREDLNYRISVFRIHVPPLPERCEDIPLLGSRVLRYSNTELGKQVQGISSRALEWLVHYQWPGNVRELENESSAPWLWCLRAVASRRLPFRTPHVSKYRACTCAHGSAFAPVGTADVRARVLRGGPARQNHGNAARTAKILGVRVLSM